MLELDIRGSGQGWDIVDHAGTVVKSCRERHIAIAALKGAETRRAKKTRRRCMCCTSEFDSWGIGNRLCRDCRGRG